MIFTNSIIALILALAPATLFAAPTKTEDSLSNLLAKRLLPAEAVKALENGPCDMSFAAMPTAPTPLPAPAIGLTLSHVAIGRGTQNYTCASASATETPKAVGAVAQLFNASCSAVRAPGVLADVTALALKYPVPNHDFAKHMLSGHHEFTDKGVPLFLLETPIVKYGYVQAKLNATSKAPDTASKGPNDLGSVAWLKLNATEGDYKEVYRLNTAGGVAPKTCEGVTGGFTVEYAAEYWFWK
ncbi:hypothetical protein BDV95DRAFT_326779 [Massariosphaeria phaeospora]|uniref:Malate dehydrogenase n=1 Tax=Massariosphaeria phaeospora TaxID=100035 RepID=A0A7C8I9R2_9PLEO|nr:hypothetical protein BDV95DRAFT_326779 [Massariosphaeria phaeospora]